MKTLTNHVFLVFIACFFSLHMASALAADNVVLSSNQLTQVKNTSLLHIQGQNRSKDNAILVIRADDSIAPSYSDRANLERVIPSGNFDIQLGFASLRTPAGRALSLDKLQQIIVFNGTEAENLTIEHVEIVTPTPFPANILAWDLGNNTSSIWPGFTPITPNAPELDGKYMEAIDRGTRMQVADPLTIDGIRGIEKILLPVMAGNWTVHLWIKDAGEWEYLPHPLVIRIYANDNLVFEQNLTPMQWIEGVYLARKESMITPMQSSWALFGQQDTIDFDITTQGEPITLRLEGDSLDSQFISAIFITPADKPEAWAQLTADRQTWWQQNWPVAPWPVAPATRANFTAIQQNKTAAKGTSALFEFLLEQGPIPGAPLIVLTPPRLTTNTVAPMASPLIATWHWSQWQLNRTALGSSLLTATNERLRAGLLPANTSLALPRTIWLRVDVPLDAAAGSYQGAIKALIGEQHITVPYQLTVLDVSLPPPNKAVGVYLEKPVHFTWFDELAPLADQALSCDLALLRKLGLTAISPPLPTPIDAQAQQTLINLTQSIYAQGYEQVLAYAPVKRLISQIGAAQASQKIAHVDAGFSKLLSPAPWWSIADEPSNPGYQQPLRDVYDSFKLFAPNAKLAGHLNNPQDNNYLNYFSLVLINDGFGIDKSKIDSLKTRANLEAIWLYNLPSPRHAAGFYLWQSGADGFLKWHARMPTADPFNPTDGREFDVQFLYPSLEPCADLPDLNLTLYQIMEGITDLRWLQWLSLQARDDPAAQALQTQLQGEIPITWDNMQALPSTQLDKWRAQIMQLAK